LFCNLDKKLRKMVGFTEIIDTVDQLSKEELEELKQAVQLKWLELRRKEIAAAAEQGRQEHADGKTIVLSTPEEIKSYFLTLIDNED